MPKLDLPAVLRVGAGAAVNQPDVEPGDGLKRPAAAVLVDVEIERRHDLRRDPPGADLVAREHGGVEHEDVEAGAAKRAGAGRAGGPPPTISASHAMAVPAEPRPMHGLRRARPGNRVAGAAREHHLEQLHRAGGERGLRSGQIEPPRADERLVEHPRHLV